jgi:hypothetical protein
MDKRPDYMTKATPLDIFLIVSSCLALGLIIVVALTSG